MEVKCTCPYCAKGFTIEVDEPERPKQTKSFSEEERARRSERMKAMRAAGIGGRPKGVKEKGHRSTWGVPRNRENTDG